MYSFLKLEILAAAASAILLELRAPPPTPSFQKGPPPFAWREKRMVGGKGGE